MQRVFTAVLVAALALGALCTSGCTDKSTKDGTGTSEPIRIGAILSLTGTYAGLGEPEENVLKMEVERLNAAGGIDGRKVEILIEDDGTDEAKAVAAAAKLIDKDQVVAIIGASGTGQSMAIRNDLKRAGVPQVSMAGGTVITGQFDPLVFQTPWSNTLVVPFVLDAVKKAGHTRIAVLSDTSGYGKDGHTILLEEVTKAGLEIVVDQTFNPGDTDMSAQLTKVKSSDAQAVVLWNAGKEAATIAKSARDLDVTLPMFGGSGQAREEFMIGAGDAAEGFVFGTGRSLIPANWGEDSQEFSVVSDFAQRYEAEYGKKPDIFAGHAFDAFRIIEDALKRAGSDADPAAVRDAIEETESLIGFGGSFTFSKDDHNGLGTDDLSLYSVKNGAWVTEK